MQVSRQLRFPEVLWSDQATSATARLHSMPVDRAICTAVVSRDRNAFSWPEKGLDQFSISSGVQGGNANSMVIADDALLGLAANHWATSNDFPDSPAPSSRRYQCRCDQQGFAPYSQRPAHFKSSAAGSMQWHGGARPKNKCSAIPNNNGTPAHLIRNVHESLNSIGINPWFIARHSQDDYFKNPEKVAADLNNRIVDMRRCMTEPFSGYDASPLPPDQSVGNGGLPAYNWADPPPRHVTAGSDYCGLPLAPADSRTQQSGNPEYPASAHQQRAAALSNRSTGVGGGFLPAHSGSDCSSYSRSEKSEEIAKTTDISITVPAMPGQRVDRPASGQSQNSPDVFSTSTASCKEDIYESDTDDSLEDLYRRKEEAHAMVGEVLRQREERDERDEREEREEREKSQAAIKQYENEVRAERERKKQVSEEKESKYAESWPAKQEAVTGESMWLCEHYQRHCQVKFDCCNVFYPCHRCHNNSDSCSNEEARAREATHYKCNFCHHEEKVDENSQNCSSCEAKMSAYFCSVCKHFTSIEKAPYHCEKCGICRIHKDKSFHCDVCNVCLDKRLQGKHRCRPDSGHDDCCICLEDAFSGCQILPCSHKVHRECAIAMIQNGVRNCPICRHPLYSAAPD